MDGSPCFVSSWYTSLTFCLPKLYLLQNHSRVFFFLSVCSLLPPAPQVHWRANWKWQQFLSSESKVTMNCQWGLKLGELWNKWQAKSVKIDEAMGKMKIFKHTSCSPNSYVPWALHPLIHHPFNKHPFLVWEFKWVPNLLEKVETNIGQWITYPCDGR